MPISGSVPALKCGTSDFEAVSNMTGADLYAGRLMRRTLKIIGWGVGTAVVLFIALLVLKWLYPPFFPKVWGATITVDGKPSRRSSLYLNRWGLLVRQGSNGRELYLFAGDDERGWVWRCEAFSFSIIPGLALTNDERYTRGCVFPNLGERDSAGRVIAKPKRSVGRNQLITAHLLEFTADDGKRVRVEW